MADMRKGIAVVAGMGVDLKLIGDRYSVIVLIFFISYVLLQPPATVVLRKLGPRTFLPSITILWGITMICFGFVKQWYELIPLRIILGIFEAGFFPVCSLPATFSVHLELMPVIGMRISSVLLVPSLRAPEAQRSILPHRQHELSLLRNPRIRFLADERPW